MRAVGELFPDMSLADDVALGGFPANDADGTPLVGPVPDIAGLYVNSGHGPLGWTFSHGAAQIIADLASGIKPEIDIEGLSVTRATAQLFLRRGAPNYAAAIRCRVVGLRQADRRRSTRPWLR